MNSPEMSVVISAYNHGRYIGEAIRSVLGQTFGGFEVIVLDDGSTDNTREVVSSFSDERLKYHYRQNSGLPACGRNSGMSLATGKYISLLDGDDFWHKEKLQRSKEVLDAMPDVGLVCHNEAVIHNGKVLRNTSYGPYRTDMYERLLLEGNCLHSSAVTLRSEIFFKDGLKFSEEKALFAIEDYEYWMRLSRKYKFFFLPESLGYYRVTETGAFLSSGGASPVNMLALLDTHFKAMGRGNRKLQRRIRFRRSAVMCGAGRMYQHNMRFTDSTGWYLAALKERPFNYKALIGLAASLLGMRIIYR